MLKILCHGNAQNIMLFIHCINAASQTWHQVFNDIWIDHRRNNIPGFGVNYLNVTV